MEIDARRQLIEELDRSLLDHTAALGQKEGGPTIGDAYELQGMAERHYYLKVEHEFTAAEVEALLAFADPLAVAAAPIPVGQRLATNLNGFSMRSSVSASPFSNS